MGGMNRTFVLALALLLVLCFGGTSLANVENQAVLRQAAEAYNAKDYAKAKKLLKPLADKNDLMATYALGMMAARGEGEKKNMQTAESWWLKSANAGNAHAQYILGGLYSSGEEGIERDFTKARTWWEKAAANKHGDAMYKLGILMFEGRGGSTDEAGAVAKFTEAAELGHPGAQFTLGRLYAEGRGVKKDVKKAKEWFAKAASAGVKPAQEMLDELNKK